MKEEFKRFELEKLGLFIILLEILGATGLLVGMIFPLILILSSSGLALLMFFAFIVRLKIKDGIGVSLPSFFYMCLNAYILWRGLDLI
jgi:hypothetical protein